jgi:hypothetical protein
MDDTLPSGEPVAEGEQFWKWVWESQTKCEALTDQMLPKEEIFGKRARETFTKLGTVASMLDRVASCWWCRLLLLHSSFPAKTSYTRNSDALRRDIKLKLCQLTKAQHGALAGLGIACSRLAQRLGMKHIRAVGGTSARKIDPGDRSKWDVDGFGTLVARLNLREKDESLDGSGVHRVE